MACRKRRSPTGANATGRAPKGPERNSDDTTAAEAGKEQIGGIDRLVAVYDGQRWLGDVIQQRDGRWAAIGPADRFLGTFGKIDDARAALRGRR